MLVAMKKKERQMYKYPLNCTKSNVRQHQVFPVILSTELSPKHRERHTHCFHWFGLQTWNKPTKPHVIATPTRESLHDTSHKQFHHVILIQVASSKLENINS